MKKKYLHNPTLKNKVYACLRLCDLTLCSFCKIYKLEYSTTKHAILQERSGPLSHCALKILSHFFEERGYINLANDLRTIIPELTFTDRVKLALNKCGSSLNGVSQELGFERHSAQYAIKGPRGPKSRKLLILLSEFLKKNKFNDLGYELKTMAVSNNLKDRVYDGLLQCGFNLRSISSELGLRYVTAKWALCSNSTGPNSKLVYRRLAYFFIKKKIYKLAYELYNIQSKKRDKSIELANKVYSALKELKFSLKAITPSLDENYGYIQSAIITKRKTPRSKIVYIKLSNFLEKNNYLNLASELRTFAALCQDAQPAPKISKLKSFLHAILKAIKRFFLFLDKHLPGEPIQGDAE